jgi:hypothetical protein
VPWAPGIKPQPKCPQEPREQLVVAQLLNPITKSWNYPPIISELFDEGTLWTNTNTSISQLIFRTSFGGFFQARD